jgi:hypothetical protein
VDELGKAITDITTRMKNEGWTPENPSDDGAFGKAVHAQISQELTGDRWVHSVLVNRTTGEVLELGAEQGRSGAVQIDSVHLKQGQTLHVGDMFTASRYDYVFEIKTSISGSISAEQKAAYQAVVADGFYVVKSEHRYTVGGGWQTNPKFRTALRTLQVIGLATTAWAVVTSASQDVRLDEIRQYIDSMPGQYRNPQNYSDEIGAREYAAEGAVKICEYMRSFDPNGGTSIDVLEGLTSYKIMLDIHW